MKYSRSDDENVPDHIDWSKYEDSRSMLGYYKGEFQSLFVEMNRLKLQGELPDIY